MSKADADILIIGGGVIGLSIANALAADGHGVLVLDSGPDRVQASRGNAGQIAPGHPPIASPSLPPQALHLILDRRSPLYIPPRPSLGLAWWLWRFRKACSPSTYELSMRLLAHLSRLSRDQEEAMHPPLPTESRPRPCGIADLWRTPEGEAAAAEETEWMTQLGFQTRTLSGHELRSEDPAWGEDVLGATMHLDGMVVDPARYCDALRAAIQSSGGMLRRTSAIQSLHRVNTHWMARNASGETWQAPRVVLAAGVWSSPLARMLGHRIRMQPAKGYHLLMDSSPRPHIAGVLRESKVAITPMHQGVRVAGTLECSGFNHRLDQERLEQIRQGAQDFIPRIKDLDSHQPWCGLRPCTASGLPTIGLCSNAPDAWIATGHGMMGLTLASGTAQLIALSVRGDAMPEWARGFSPA